MKKKLLKSVNWKVPKKKKRQKKYILILIQMKNKIKITATQIERKNKLTRNEDGQIGTHGQHEIQDKIQGM